MKERPTRPPPPRREPGPESPERPARRRLHTFRGDGLIAGVDLADGSALLDRLDEEPYSQPDDPQPA